MQEVSEMIRSQQYKNSSIHLLHLFMNASFLSNFLSNYWNKKSKKDVLNDFDEVLISGIEENFDSLLVQYKSLINGELLTCKMA